MATIIKMPKLTDTMANGKIYKWHKALNDTVKKGDILAEIETDKANMEFEVEKDGILLFLGANQGEEIPVNNILAIIGEKNENIIEYIQKNQEVKFQNLEKDGKELQKKEKFQITNLNQQPPCQKRIIASPLAKKLSKENNINLQTLMENKENHQERITKKDILEVLEKKNKELQSDFYDAKVSTNKQIIAKNLTISQQTVPHFYLTITINVNKLVALRNALNEKFNKFSFNDFIVMATAKALESHKELNTSWLGNTIRFFKSINIGIAISANDKLYVAVIKEANKKKISEISGITKNFTEKAKLNTLSLEEMSGSTFTISNLGMYCVEFFNAIINNNEACIIAIGQIQKKPIVENETITIGHIMKISLSCDHRVVNGNQAAMFLQTLKNLIENPELTLI